MVDVLFQFLVFFFLRSQACEVLGCDVGGVFGNTGGIIGEGSGYHVNMPDTCLSRALCHIL